MKLRVWIARLEPIARAALSRTRLFGTVYVSFCKRFPVDPSAVLLESHLGLEFLGNPYYLAHHILQSDRYQHLKVVIVCPRRSIRTLRRAFAPGQPRFCRVGSIRYLYHLATAGHLVNDATFPLYFSRRPEQKYLNTWHGTPLKRVGRESSGATFEFLSNEQRNFLHATDLLAPNQHTERVLLQDYMIENVWPGCVIRCGYPQNDVFFQQRDSSTISRDSVINIAFIPAWDPGQAMSEKARTLQVCQLRSLFAILERRLPDSTTLWIRLNPRMENSLDLSGYQRLKPFPADVEPYAHLAGCSALVTDYSPVIFDFAPTGRPIFLYTPQVATVDMNRDLYISLDELPFARTNTPEALADCLASLSRDNEKSQDSREDFISKYCSRDTGNSAAVLCSHLFLEEENVEVYEQVPTNNRSNVLIFCGAMLNNGITASLKTLVSQIDLQRCDITLWFEVSTDDHNVENYFRRLDSAIAFIPTRSELTLSPREVLRRLIRELILAKRSLSEALDEAVWRREWQRLFSDSHFDTVVHFSGYDRRAACLLSVSSARRVMFVHNEMVEEVEKKDVDAHALNSAYRSADVIALVRENLDKTYNASVVDISAKTIFVPNMLRTNYGDLSRQTVSAALSQVCEQTMVARLQKLLRQDKAYRFINLARFAEEKGQERLIEAFEQVREDEPKCQLFILGGYGPIYDRVRKRAAISPAAVSIFVSLGSDNPYPLVAEMNTMVVASNYEGRPLVIYEAMALGLSVLSTDIPGPAEVLNQGYGLVVENSISGLTHGMRMAIRGDIPQRAYDFGEHNRFALEQFYKAVGV